MSETHDDTPRYLRPYVRAAARHGGTFEAQLWRNREGQRIRFEAIVSLAGTTSFEGRRVLDLGCGIGDFAAHLADTGIAVAEGVGVEAVPELRGAAAARDLPRWSFRAGDFVADPTVIAAVGPDVVVCSGSLNTLPPRRAREVVTHAYAASRLGVVFNFLSDAGTRAGEDLHPARRFDTMRMLRFAVGLSPRVAFRQDHLDGHDACIWIARTNPALG